MSHKHYINEVKGSLLEVVDASEMVEMEDVLNSSPFKKESVVLRLQKAFKKGLIKLTENILGLKLYTENTLHELITIDPKIRSILLKYINNGFIKSWSVDVITQTKSYIVGITIKVNNLETETGATLKLQGATGCGVGYTINQAMIPAIAELVERHSYAIFDVRNLILGSQKELFTKGARSLTQFSFFTEAQKREHSELSRNTYTEETKIYWTKAVNIKTGQKCLIPAQLVYVFLSDIHKEQPLFFKTNSTGTASYSNTEEAQFRALAEVIERDAFLFYWLKKITPEKIDKKSIDSEEIKNLIQNIEKQSFKLEILNMTTDLGVPVIVSVIHGSSTRSFAAIGASCDFNTLAALKKSLFEAARVAQFYEQPELEDFENAKMKYPLFTTFKERYAWWTIPENQKEMEFLLSGPVIPFEEIAPGNKSFITNTNEKLELLRNIFIEKNIEAYTVDITSKEASEVGLYVHKAIIPDLIPMYFKEYAKPLNIKRLHSRVNGFSDGGFINQIPHPFL